MIRLGIIGCGNMGGAILRQWLKAGKFQADEIIAADKNADLREKLHTELGVSVTADNREAAKAPCLLLAVKPQYAPAVGKEIEGAVNPNALVLSIMAGYDLRMLHDLLKNGAAHIIRVMPNTPAMVGEGAIAACRGRHVTDEEWRRGMELLSCMGLAEEAEEKWMDAVTGLSGSSPAFVFMFLEALSDAGVRAGLPRALATRLAAQTLVGSGRLAQETGLHPGQLKDMVTSPAGTTIEGVAALEKGGFRAAVLDAVDAAVKKSQSFHS